MNENINALDEICKGACMGMDAIHFILEKVEDKDYLKVIQLLLENKYSYIQRMNVLKKNKKST